MSRYRSRSSHLWTHKVRASAFALPAFKVPIRRAGTALTWASSVSGIHTETHATTRFSPFKTCVSENLVEAFHFRLTFDRL